MALEKKTIKNILLGVTGGIAAYKCAELVRLMKIKNHCWLLVLVVKKKNGVD